MTACPDRSRGSVLPRSVMRVCSPVSFMVLRLRDGYRHPAAQNDGSGAQHRGTIR